MKKSTKREIMMAKMPQNYHLSDESEYYKLLEDLALAVAPINLPVSECEVWDWIENNVRIFDVNTLIKDHPNKAYATSGKVLTANTGYSSSSKYPIYSGETIVIYHPIHNDNSNIKVVVSTKTDGTYDSEFNTLSVKVFVPLAAVNQDKYFAVTQHNNNIKPHNDLIFIIKGIDFATIAPEEEL